LGQITTTSVQTVPTRQAVEFNTTADPRFGKHRVSMVVAVLSLQEHREWQEKAIVLFLKDHEYISIGELFGNAFVAICNGAPHPTTQLVSHNSLFLGVSYSDDIQSQEAYNQVDPAPNGLLYHYRYYQTAQFFKVIVMHLWAYRCPKSCTHRNVYATSSEGCS